MAITHKGDFLHLSLPYKGDSRAIALPKKFEQLKSKVFIVNMEGKMIIGLHL